MAETSFSMRWATCRSQRRFAFSGCSRRKRSRRRGDIPLLLEAFRQRTALSSGKQISGFTKDATELLISCDWPGNVRELINVVEYAFVVCPGGQISREHLPPWLAASCETNGTERTRGDEDERERVVEALAASGGNRSKAARLLGMSRVTLWKRLKNYKLAKDPQPGQGSASGD